MQSELKSLQRKLGITFIFVTHDQHEALSMSDRIGVFNHGRLEQVATPSDLYNRPSTRFVAEFVGAANLLQGQDALRFGPCEAVVIRPERIALAPNPLDDGSGTARLHGVVREVQFFGSFWRVSVVRPQVSEPMLVDVPVHGRAVAPGVGDSVQLFWSDAAVHQLQPGAVGTGSSVP